MQTRLLSVLMVLCMLGAWGLYQQQNNEVQLEVVQADALTWLDNQQESVWLLFADSVWHKRFPQEWTAAELAHLHDLPMGIFAWRNDSLVCWNRYDFLPAPPGGSGVDTLIHLANGYYWQFRQAGPHGLQLVAHIPLKMTYAVSNRYLQTETPFLSTLPRGVTWEASGEAGLPLERHGVDLGQLVVQQSAGKISTPVLWLLGIGILLVLVVVSRWLRLWGGSRMTWWVFLMLVVLIGGIRWGTLHWYPEWLLQADLFSPRHYAASDLIPSLGDLLIHVLLVLFLAVYAFRWLPVWRPDSAAGRTLVSIAGFAFMAVGGFYVLELAESLVLNSSVVFNVNNFFALNSYSLIGLLIMAFLVTAWFLLSYRWLTFWWTHRSGLPAMIVQVLAGFGLFAAVALFFWPWQDVTITVLSAAAVTMLFALFAAKSYQLRSFWIQVAWIMLFSGMVSLYLHRFNQVKERELQQVFARSLTQQDHLTEFLYSRIRPSLLDDAFIRGYFANPLLSKSQLERMLRNRYFKELQQQYTIDIYTYLGNDIPYKNSESIPLSSYFIRIDSSGRRTSIPDLYFFPETPDNLEYLAMVRIHSDPDNPLSTNLIGRVVVSLKVQSLGGSSVYPELLLQDGLKRNDISDRYDYALYVRHKLAKRQGDFPFPLRHETTGRDVFTTYTDSNREHMIFEELPGRSVWISRERPSIVVPLSMFSYLFCLYLLLLLPAYLIVWVYRGSRGDWPRFRWRYVTLRTKVQLFMLFVIIASFGLIGWLTINNIIRQYESYHYDRLLRKAGQVMSGLEYLRDGQSDTLRDWRPFLASEELLYHVNNLSDIHAIDINLYSNDGQLLQTSQPDIFRKGLIGDLEDPVARQKILGEQQSQYIQTESIGGLTFLSAYMPLLDKQFNVIAVLNLPYFAKEKNLQIEINDFLVYFINIYVLLFVLAGMLGIVVSNSLTRPLQVLSDKLKAVQLGRRNEPIPWSSRDEVGQLIAEYNKMIGELEESAANLAKGERESAWREMARQVAHEIKNPLTPMKLSIQLLERAYKDHAPDLEQRVARVSATLIEQIDNLTRIANEFSLFAKMPAANLEIVNLRELLAGTAELFRQQVADMQLVLPAEAVYVYADKNYMLRVCNNVMQNAVQAIPEDRQGRIEVRMEAQGNEVVVAISDNGTGISDEQADKVFVPNFTTKSSGMGLGLAMARQMVEQCAGKIWFTTEVGQGTTFFISLPLYSEEK